MQPWIVSSILAPCKFPWRRGGGRLEPLSYHRGCSRNTEAIGHANLRVNTTQQEPDVDQSKQGQLELELEGLSSEIKHNSNHKEESSTPEGRAQ